MHEKRKARTSEKRKARTSEKRKAEKKGNNKREDYDSPWKEILDRFFERFIAFYFPKAHKLIDWRSKKNIQFLDKELQKLTPEAEEGRRIVDKLVKVVLKNGGEKWVLIHIEVQSQMDPNLAKRVFVCNYRIFDRYKREVASLVILSDPSSDWRPNNYSYSVFDSEMKLSFPVVKLLDFAQDEKRLLRSTNPFAIVTLAQIKAIKTHRSLKARMEAKMELIRLLHKRKDLRKDVIDLLRFIDWILKLPENMERELREIMQKEAKAMGIPYISSWERMAKEEGRQEGRQEGIQEGALKTLREKTAEILNIRFGDVPAMIAGIINGIDKVEVLEELHSQAVKCASLDEFAEHLPVAV